MQQAISQQKTSIQGQQRSAAFRFAGGIILLMAALWFSACTPNNTYEKNLPIEDRVWTWGEPYTFEVDVRDTLSDYNLFINVRHTNLYPKSNLWLKVITEKPSGEIENDRVEVALAERSGRWNGICTGDICFLSQLVAARRKLNESGTYKFTFEQDMRDSVLMEMLAIGMRMEKVPPSSSPLNN